MDIKLLIGIDDIKFGDEYSKLINIFGEPSEIDNIESFYDDKQSVTVIDFEDCELTVYLEGEETKRITDFETENNDITLFGNKIYDMHMEEVIKLMKENGFEDYEIETESSEKILSFMDGQIDFNFKHNKLISVMWSVERNIDFTPKWQK